MFLIWWHQDHKIELIYFYCFFKALLKIIFQKEKKFFFEYYPLDMFEENWQAKAPKDHCVKVLPSWISSARCSTWNYDGNNIYKTKGLQKKKIFFFFALPFILTFVKLTHPNILRLFLNVLCVNFWVLGKLSTTKIYIMRLLQGFDSSE